MQDHRAADDGLARALQAPRAPADLLPRIMAEVTARGARAAPAAHASWLGAGAAVTAAWALGTVLGRTAAAGAAAGAAAARAAALVQGAGALWAVAGSPALRGPLAIAGAAALVAEALVLARWLRPSGR